MRKNGFTLLEILVVLLIVALLLALLLPAIQNTRRRGHDATCLSNMRQILSAISIYRNDYDLQLPHRLRPVSAYVKTHEIFHCPADGTANGISHASRYERIPRLSYLYFAQYTERKLFLELIPSLDPNHGILACIVHPSTNLENRSPFFADHVRRGLLDGSVIDVHKRLPMEHELSPRDRENRWANGCLNGWLLYTNAPCPVEYCQRTECFD